MEALKELLPEPKSSTATYYHHSYDPWFKQLFTATEEEKSIVPPYLKRSGWGFRWRWSFPGNPRDTVSAWYGKEWEFEEILTVTVDVHGNVACDAMRMRRNLYISSTRIWYQWFWRMMRRWRKRRLLMWGLVRQCSQS